MATRLEMLLAERRRRAARALEVTPAAVAFMAASVSIVAALRRDFHGPQRAFYCGVPKRKAAKTTRRSGKTSGGTRETMARCLEQPGYRVVYCNTTKTEAKRLAWRSDTRRDGWIDLLRIYGLRVTHKRESLDKGDADCFVDETEKTIDFANGSQLAIFTADDDAALDKLRGAAKHVVWIDEAQKFTNLSKFVDDILGGNMTDFEGEIWLTGTPGDFCAGYFYEATKEESQGERIPGWDVGEWSVLDNPFFGRTREERFVRAVRPKILEKKPRSWVATDEEWIAEFMRKPPAWFVREWQGKWVLEGALFVYPVHEVHDQEALCFAPMRQSFDAPPRAPEGHVLESIDVGEFGWIDIAAALADLPEFLIDHNRRRRPITWLHALSADFGYDPDPFALSWLAFSPDHADIYEMWSWKQTRVHPDDQRDAIRGLVATIPSLVVCVGDPGGLKSGDLEGWRERLGLDITDADKHGKRTWIRLMGAEITSGRFHYRDDSPLLHEHRHLLWIAKVNKATGDLKLIEHKTRSLPDKSVPGNHCSDAGLYGYRHLVYRRTTFPGWEDSLPEHLRNAREEAAMESWVDRQGDRADLQDDDPAAYAADDRY